ncbi:MAG: toxin-antitoxin system HicB family antitoxin [Deltaproteobacteria bacterium]|nr:toxin-antitoxin system HicB family antitoxin [Deltaproteobacteria bacterium]
MKRIINGKTFNSETATTVFRLEKKERGASRSEEIDGYLDSETLYRTRQGNFFLVDTEIKTNFDKEGFPLGAGPVKRLKPLTPEGALNWLRSHNVSEEQIRQQFGDHLKDMTEESTVYLRVPQSLKLRLEACANNKGQSLNTWVMRCLERAAWVEEEGGAPVIDPEPGKAEDCYCEYEG